MLIGLNIKIVEDSRYRKLIQIKNDKNGYYLTKKNNEIFPIILKNSFIYSVSIAIVIGYLFKLSYIIWILIASIIYIAYFLFFNIKIMPSLQYIRSDKIILKNVRKSSTNTSKNIYSVAYILIGIALIACVPLGLVDEGTSPTLVIIIGVAAIAFSVISRFINTN